MPRRSQTVVRTLIGAARRVGAFVQAMETSPFEALDDRLQRLEVRLANIEGQRAPLSSEPARRARGA